MRPREIGFAGAGFALVDAVEGAAVAEIMLGGGEHGSRTAKLPLQAADHRFGIHADFGRIRTVAFVGPAPARVLDDGQGRSERPGDASCPNLLCSHSADASDQRRIMRCAKPDIVREKRRAVDVVIAVNRVDAPNHRHPNLHVGRHRGAVEFVG